MLIRKTTETETGSPDFCCNSGRLDRYGDIVLPAGIDLKQFSRNNIALLNHNADARRSGVEGYPKVTSTFLGSIFYEHPHSPGGWRACPFGGGGRSSHPTPELTGEVY